MNPKRRSISEAPRPLKARPPPCEPPDFADAAREAKIASIRYFLWTHFSDSRVRDAPDLRRDGQLFTVARDGARYASTPRLTMCFASSDAYR